MDASVSVVVPTHNRAAYLPLALRSALAQTATNVEIVVVDDGSTDDTQRVLREFEPRVRVVRQDNRGVAHARNRGVNEARAPLVAFLDSDDLWMPRTLESLVRALERHPEAGVATMNAEEIDAAGQRLGRRIGKRTPGCWFTTEGLLLRDHGSVLTPIVRRAPLLECGGFDESLSSAEDYDMWLRLSLRTRILHVPETLLLRRVHDESLSTDGHSISVNTLRSLEKVRRLAPPDAQPAPSVWRRALARQHLRIASTSVCRDELAAEDVERARRHARAALAFRPTSWRAIRVFAAVHLAPAAYRRARRAELARNMAYRTAKLGREKGAPTPTPPSQDARS